MIGGPPGRVICTADRPASDDARWVVAIEHLQKLCSTVRFERPARVFGQIERIGCPRRSAYLDHHTRQLVAAADFPQPSASIKLACPPAEAGPDLPAHVGPNRSARMRRGSCPRATSASATPSTNPVGPHR